MIIDELTKKFNEGKELTYEETDWLLTKEKHRTTVIQECVNLLENISHDWCMCGNMMNQHRLSDNHTPISSFDYYFPEVIKLLKNISQ